MRRIPGQRKRQPPGGDATCREKHRRTAGGSQRHFHQLRQSGIDEELFDVIAGFEALAKERNTPEQGVRGTRIEP